MNTVIELTGKEIKDFYFATYIRVLEGRLEEKATDGVINQVLVNDMIDGDLLNSVDAHAYDQTKMEFSWRNADLVRETVCGDDGNALAEEYAHYVDYDAIMLKARTLSYFNDEG